jgi:predicted Rossmann fold flavoprotein
MTVGIVGAGPAGLMASITAAQAGARVVLFEKNTLPGRKLLLTGNGRCNLTNRLSIREYPDRYFGNGKFLIKALHSFGPEDTEHFFESLGVRLKEEAGGRVFPASNRAADVLGALFDYAERLGVRFVGAESVLDIRKNRSGAVSRIITVNGAKAVDACVLCVGGQSYPTTGSAGDGTVIASRLGHAIIPMRPALAPIDIVSDELPMIPGVSLAGVRVSVVGDGNILAARTGDVLYTHHGLSGPVILSLSRSLPIGPEEYGGRIRIDLDLWPDGAEEDAGDRMMRLLSENKNSRLFSVLRAYFPSSFLEHLFARTGVSPDVYCRDLRKEARKSLLKVLRNLSYTVSGPPLFSTAMTTAGGVCLREVDPRTMSSRLVDGLFFAGELLDIDGDTGGFNLQAAFATGYLAGKSAAEYSGSRRKVVPGDFPTGGTG